MTYRERQTDDRFATPRSGVPERELPEPCHVAFDQFERLLEQRQREQPIYLQSPLGDVQETLFPNYDLATPTLGGGVLGCVAMTALGIFLVGAVTFAAWELSTPEAIQWTAIIGGALLLLAQIVWWVSHVRTWASIRRRPRPPAYGTFLLTDAVVVRYLRGCDYVPRSAVLEVFEATGSFGQSPKRYSPSIRYRKADGKEGTIQLAWMLEEPEDVRTQVAHRWLAQTAPQHADSG
jgi:hypothetical protein